MNTFDRTSFKRYWPDIGIVFSLVTTIYVYAERSSFTWTGLLLWLSLISLFFHQFEEYRVPGGFKRTLNRLMFGNTSSTADQYPLNSRTALIINVWFGWVLYFLAAICAEKAIWLGIASMIVSIGNVLVHTFYLNIKGKTLYNPGMLTALIFFLPLSIMFFHAIIRFHAAGTSDYVIGIILGLLLGYVGIFKLIDWLKDIPR